MDFMFPDFFEGEEEEHEGDFPDLPSPPTATTRKVAVALARAFLAGESAPGAMQARGCRALGRSWPWLVPLTLHLHFELAPGGVWQPEQHDALVARILAFPPFLAAFESSPFAPVERPRIRCHFPFFAPMGLPPPALAGLNLPALATPGDLADWLRLSPAHLDWFANVTGRDFGEVAPKLEHYHARWVAKASGGARLIEAPKAELRALQRRILRGILDGVPVHPAAYGCVRGRSVVENAALHGGASLLLKLDLRDFFVRIRASRIHALFCTLGYPPVVARLLTGLTTRCTPARLLRNMPQETCPSPEERRDRQRWARQFTARHLPQGAPTSPALANLCAWRLDTRLSGAARECRARYSRYVDDLAFSCDATPAQGRRILAMMQDIILEEGFVPNWRKTRLLPASTSQRLTGLVVNQRPNLPRQEYDTLKAILTNCRRHGPNTQNRLGLPDFRAHLLGRIGWFRQVNPARGERLRALFAGIEWA
jgi:hypothetical protein